jgi:hypothetical protein
MRSMELTAYKNKGIRIGDKVYKKVRIYKGRPLRDVPSSYKECGGFVANELSSLYNSGVVTVYKARDGGLRYEVYRDGSFYPYYGKLEIIE